MGYYDRIDGWLGLSDRMPSFFMDPSSFLVFRYKIQRGIRICKGSDVARSYRQRKDSGIYLRKYRNSVTVFIIIIFSRFRYCVLYYRDNFWNLDARVPL